MACAWHAARCVHGRVHSGVCARRAHDTRRVQAYPQPILAHARHGQAEPSLYWLDFFDALLSPDGDALAAGLALDGTHLHPSYVSLLEAALPQ